MAHFEQVLDDDERIGAALVELGEERQSSSNLPFHQELEEVQGLRAVGKAEHETDLFGHRRAGTMGDRLVEEREAVAHRAVGCARDEPDRLRGHERTLGRRDLAKVCCEDRLIDAAQVEALAAREDGDRHLADLGRGEDELHMLGRLLERLREAR